MKIIGLTGNSGSGKGKVSKILQNYGGYIIDSDKIAHEIILPYKKAYFEILQFFDSSILDKDKTINRKKLGNIVFNDNEKRLKLIEITHKYILEETELQIENVMLNSQNYKFIVIDAPLLIEANLHTKVDEVWVVYASEETRLSRIINRDNISVEQAYLRFKNQLPFDELKKYATEIIDNDKPSLYELDKSVSCIINRFLL